MNTQQRLARRMRMHFKQQLGKHGYEIRRRDSLFDPKGIGGISLSPLEIAMSVLLRHQEMLSIVQVGANDGRFNDPIHAFCARERSRTRVLLIEPQVELIPYLKASYADHPSAFPVCCAVGEPGTLTLYSVDASCWGDCDVPYAQGWPEYRAPTGITSANRENVARWLQAHYVGNVAIDEIIRSRSVPCKPLIEILEDAAFGRTVDVLQIDVEGLDDYVIDHSSVEELSPALINFEHLHLSRERLAVLVGRLEGLGYAFYFGDMDVLAVKL